MTAKNQTEKDFLTTNTNTSNKQTTEKILCPHCLRTATNNIKCKGICVADSDY